MHIAWAETLRWTGSRKESQAGTSFPPPRRKPGSPLGTAGEIGDLATIGYMVLGIRGPECEHRGAVTVGRGKPTNIFRGDRFAVDAWGGKMSWAASPLSKSTSALRPNSF